MTYYFYDQTLYRDPGESSAIEAWNLSQAPRAWSHVVPSEQDYHHMKEVSEDFAEAHTAGADTKAYYHDGETLFSTSEVRPQACYYRDGRWWSCRCSKKAGWREISAEEARRYMADSDAGVSSGSG